MDGSFTLAPFKKQEQFVSAFFEPQYTRLLYGGAIRGGKTFVLMIILIMLCKMWPRSRHVIIRRDLPTLKRNTYPVFDKVVPSKFLLTFNKTDQIARFRNGSEIIFLPESIHDDPELNRFHGLEFNTAALEEVDELQEKTYYKTIERAGTWIQPTWGDNPCPSKIISSCNPSQTWVKNLWYLPFQNGLLKAPYYYLPAKIVDNPHIPQWYIDGLHDMPPELYKVFVEGSWDATDAIHQLVPWEAIESARSLIVNDDATTSIGADIGREGPDPTIITVLRGLNIVEITKMPTSKTFEASDMIQRKMAEYNVAADHVTVDSVGVGGGVVDDLFKHDIYVVPFIGGATQDITGFGGMSFTLEELTQEMQVCYRNWKAFAYWVAADYMKKRMVGGFTDETLRADTAAVYAFYKSDKTFQVEDKDQIKKRIGRSPDYWESFVYACWSYYSGKMLEDFDMMYTSAQHKGVPA